MFEENAGYWLSKTDPHSRSVTTLLDPTVVDEIIAGAQ